MLSNRITVVKGTSNTHTHTHSQRERVKRALRPSDLRKNGLNTDGFFWRVCVLVLATYRAPKSSFCQQSEDFKDLSEGSDIVSRLGLKLGVGEV